MPSRTPRFPPQSTRAQMDAIIQARQAAVDSARPSSLEDTYKHYKESQEVAWLAHRVRLPSTLTQARSAQMDQFCFAYEAGLLPDCPTTVTLHPSYADLVPAVVLGAPLHAQLEQAVGNRNREIMAAMATPSWY
jgi:hypothetical protein